MVHEDRSVLDLLDADYTFVNERLAKHYGIRGIYGPDFRRVPVPSDARRGLLGQGSMLLVTSNANRTSPVQRGKWILENLLGSPPPLPPPNVPPLKENSGEARRHIRSRAHGAAPRQSGLRRMPQNHGPHRARAREFRRSRPLAQRGFRDSRSMPPANWWMALEWTGHPACAQALLDRPDAFVGTMTEKLLMYAVGRETKYYDMPVVRAVMRDAAQRSLPVLRSGVGNCEERTVSDENERSSAQSGSSRKAD